MRHRGSEHPNRRKRIALLAVLEVGCTGLAESFMGNGLTTIARFSYHSPARAFSRSSHKTLSVRVLCKLPFSSGTLVAKERGMKNPTLLLVDDDLAVLAALTNVLRSKGHT